MSHSPISPRDKRDSYEAGWGQILDFINTGGSWSGHERNCCFLNTGGTRFADVSAVTGLDFLDDGRCVAAVDWDMDGDLDLWLASRTGPRLRFVRNDTNDGSDRDDTNFLALRLIGQTCNRDAIGARVRVKVDGKDLIRTLYAGDGYLTQSSKWIHVGLGDATEIDSLTVHWPGGNVETFSDVTVNSRFKLTQGAGKAIPWPADDRSVKLAASPIATQHDTPSSRVVLLDRIPLPSLDYVDFDDQPRSIPGPSDGPMLVNLWAAWCVPCRAELTQWAESESELRAAGLRIVALSVDGLGDDSSDIDKAKTMMSGINFPFETGQANPELLDKLDVFQHLLISLRAQKDVLPTSFLVDRFGRLAVIYPGTVDVKQLLHDVRMIETRSGLASNAAFPFQGRWFAQPRRTGPLLVEFASEFKNRNNMADALRFAGLAADLATRDGIAPELSTQMAYLFLEAGKTSLEQDRPAEARQHFIACLRLQPTWAEAHADLARAYHLLDSLPEAERHFSAALNQNPRLTAALLGQGGLYLDMGRLPESVRLLRAAVQVDPNSADGHNKLGIALARLGQAQQAMNHFKSAIQYGHADARRNLQLVLAGKTP